VTSELRTSASGWRRHVASAFIVVWLSVQIGVPIVQKLDAERPDSPYRYARYSWAMFSRLVPRYELSLYRVRGSAAPEPIPNIGHYVKGYRSPQPMRLMAIYSSEEEVIDRYGRLVGTIAAERRDGYTYVAFIRWTAHRLGTRETVELRADALP
jgi:hypothetical protein